MSEELCEVVITAPESEWLANFGRQLVEDRLCACAHHFAAIRSVYRWKGEIFDEPEARVALHTRRSLVHEIVTRTNEQHPYDVPAVSALPIVDGSASYLQWIRDETKER